jgi:hypothetical protein
MFGSVVEEKICANQPFPAALLGSYVLRVWLWRRP